VESFLKLSQARTIQRLQAGTTGTGPFAKENISETFAARVGAQSLFESTPEKHRRTRVLIPSSHPDSDADNVEGKSVLADLCVAVGHPTTCGFSRLTVKVLPSGRLCKTVESEQGTAVESDVTDLDHTLQTH
jgi:hypothetical protein